MKLSDELDILIQKYQVRAKSEDITQGTLKASTATFLKLKKYLGHLSPENLTTEMWQKFQQKYDEKVGGTQFQLAKHTTILVKHLTKKGLITKVPEIKNMFSRREEAARKKRKSWVMSPEDIKSLYKACDTDHERLAIALGERLAFRISDILKLSWERIIVGQGDEFSFIRFSGEDKAKKTVDIPVPTEIMEMLLKIPKNGPWVFPQKRNTNKYLKAQQMPFIPIRDRAGLKKGGWHDLRRYRLSADFNNSAIPHALTISLRRIEFNTALRHYIVTRKEDLKLMLEKSK